MELLRKNGTDKNVERNIQLFFSDLHEMRSQKELLNKPKTVQDEIIRKKKAEIRDGIITAIRGTKYEDEVKKQLFRPLNEMYIKIPHPKEFHSNFPNFFGPGLSGQKEKQKRTFKMILMPSGKDFTMLLSQDNPGTYKSIQSYKSQVLLGKWVLEDFFGLKPYEPLTQEKMDKRGVNGIRLYKIKGHSEIYFKFIKIDDENIPEDFWPKPSK